MTSSSPAQLLQRARQAAQAAYAPYSQFPVGAALLLGDGTIHTGCNVENASFGMTICAERNAVTSAVAERTTDATPRIEAIAIVGLEADGSPCPPCGACRQVLAEFGAPTVILEEDGHPVELDFSADVLPHAFGPSDVEG